MKDCLRVIPLGPKELGYLQPIRELISGHFHLFLGNYSDPTWPGESLQVMRERCRLLEVSPVLLRPEGCRQDSDCFYYAPSLLDNLKIVTTFNHYPQPFPIAINSPYLHIKEEAPGVMSFDQSHTVCVLLHLWLYLSSLLFPFFF